MSCLSKKGPQEVKLKGEETTYDHVTTTCIISFLHYDHDMGWTGWMTFSRRHLFYALVLLSILIPTRRKCSNRVFLGLAFLGRCGGVKRKGCLFVSCNAAS